MDKRVSSSEVLSSPFEIRLENVLHKALSIFKFTNPFEIEVMNAGL